MALVPLRAVDGEQLVELARGNEAVFVLSAEVNLSAPRPCSYKRVSAHLLKMSLLYFSTG